MSLLEGALAQGFPETSAISKKHRAA